MPTSEVKRTYEAMFLVDSAVATAEAETVKTTIDTIFDRAKAEVISCRKWDERRLAYPIARAKRGTYFLAYFKALPAVIDDLERDVRLNESILRVLVLNAEDRTEAEITAHTPAQAEDEKAKEDGTDKPVAKAVDPAALVATVEAAKPAAAAPAKEEAPVAKEEATEAETEASDKE